MPHHRSFRCALRAPRATALAAALATLVALPAVAQSAVAVAPAAATLPPGDLGATLAAFSRATGLQVIADPALLRDKRSPGGSVAGDPQQALSGLLRGTELGFHLDGDTVIVQAAAAPAASAAATPAGGDAIDLDQIVVTGTATQQPKFLAPYAVSTVGAEAIARQAPRSVVDLLRSVPGVTVENSGGEAGGENVVIRGLPWSGFRLLDVLEDGLPLFESNYERQLQIDEVYRLDLGTTDAEVVRGGTAPIYSNNASGGVLNFITNHGTDTPSGALKLTGGADALARIDGVVSGPVKGNDALQYAVSGFYRQSDGLRDPGFGNGNQGGQLKLGGTYKFDYGKLFADFKYLNDRGVFYSAIPLADPRNGDSLADLIDPGTGTLNSASLRNVSIRTLDGQGASRVETRDLADGVHPVTRTLTVGGDTQFANGWRLSDKARYVNGDVGFNALFNGAPTDAAALLASRLAAARAAFPGTSSLRYALAGSNTPFDPASTAGLAMINTWSSTQTHYSDLVNDLRLGRLFDLAGGGSHDVSMGLSFSRFALRQAQIGNALLTDVRSNPDALDIQALSAAGQVLGTLTENGFTAYGSGDLIGDSHGTSTALYAADTWKLDDAWEVDAGLRRVWRREEGNRGVIGTQTVATTGPLAARTVTGLVGSVPYSKDMAGTSWTLGASYKLAEPVNVFARYTESFSFPRLSEQWGNVVNGVGGRMPDGSATPVTPIRQAELGVKYATRPLELVLIGFYSDFRKLNSSTYVANANGLLVNVPLLIDTRTEGVEFEGTWRPLGGLELTGSVTLQDPRISGADTFSGLSGAALVDNEIPRVPKYSWSLQPSYRFQVGEVDARAYATWFGTGRRFQDFTNASVLPAYRTLDLGLHLQLDANLSAQLLCTNVTDSHGLTEGNARAPGLSGDLVQADATVGRPIFGRSYVASLQWAW
ncbi:TonB-dependent receptor domain-containing protein [Pseudoxanthomonas winnipegensis]|uniref:TonB-dependent receptor n=1 Tax=Pseudoxanthomonas winnipegensis TaxID=2480810 RepID=A0A4Q8LT98_9GAMM|nr:TonB-dependent receptor [Pseudoxanthomonas winnipegensis]TAA35171.1 TonB-dependent receptor [Pseudoxanthomonas winnipegensis]